MSDATNDCRRCGCERHYERCKNDGCKGDAGMPEIRQDGATNDMTRTELDACVGDARENIAVVWCGQHSRPQYQCVIKRLNADLDRLAGPVCDHPPCKGARAVEHAEKYSYVDWKAYVDLKPYGRGVVIDGQPQTHPDWPEGEAWLRARSAK